MIGMKVSICGQYYAIACNDNVFGFYDINGEDVDIEPEHYTFKLCADFDDELLYVEVVEEFFVDIGDDKILEYAAAAMSLLDLMSDSLRDCIVTTLILESNLSYLYSLVQRKTSYLYN